jgi:hypothetical protein
VGLGALIPVVREVLFDPVIVKNEKLLVGPNFEDSVSAPVRCAGSTPLAPSCEYPNVDEPETRGTPGFTPPLLITEA